MKVTMLLAAAAQVVNGKLYILGGGWSIIGPEPSPSALAIKIEVPWTETNRPHDFQLDLLTEDHQPVIIENKPVQLKGQFEVGRPVGLPPGIPLDAAIAININPLPLAPGRRYLWELSINTHTHEDWRVAFITRAQAAQAQQTGP